METILDQLIAERKAKKIKQNDIAQKMGIKREKLSKIENKHQEASIEFVHKYAEALDYEPYLLKIR